MVSISIREEIYKIRESIINNKNLETAFYNYVNKTPCSIIESDFKYIEDKVALLGFNNIQASYDDIEQIIKRTPIKGIGYGSNFYRFLGIHLAADSSYIDKVNSRFDYEDYKHRYALSKCFSNYTQKLKKIIVSEETSDDIYLRLLKLLFTDNIEFSIDDAEEVLQIFFNSTLNFDVIDLILLEEIQKKYLGISYNNCSALEMVTKVLYNFGNSIKKITTDRYNNRVGLKINDEYDVQDILFTMLKGLFDDLEREDPISKFAGTSHRIDLNIKSQGIMIEVKMIKESDKDQKKYIKELIEDIIVYSEWKELKDLIFITYDPYNRTTDDKHFKQLEGIYDEKGVKFNVHSILVK
jgi:hypothetical protein